MLIARGNLAFRSARYNLKLALGANVFGAAIDRDGLVFHSRFFPPAQDATVSVSIVCLLEGKWASDMGGETIEAPAAFAFREDVAPDEAWARRAEGSPYRAIEIHVPLEYATLGAMPNLTMIPGSPALWDHAQKIFESEDDEGIDQNMLRLLDELGQLGALRSDTAAKAGELDEGFVRMWGTLRPLVESMYLSPTVKELADTSGLGTRDLEREMKGFLDAIPTLNTGWRFLARRTRLRLALLLLSAEGVSVDEVARLAGYGSSTAMGRAFRDIGMLAPSEIQRRIAALLKDSP